MDKQGFRTMLEGRKVPAEKMESALELAGADRCRFAIHLPEDVGQISKNI